MMLQAIDEMHPAQLAEASQSGELTSKPSYPAPPLPGSPEDVLSPMEVPPLKELIGPFQGARGGGGVGGGGGGGASHFIRYCILLPFQGGMGRLGVKD